MLRKILSVFLCAALLFTVMPSWAAAAEPGAEQASGVSLQQAIDMALKHSKALQQAEYNVERGNEVQKAADLRVKYRPLSPSTDPVADAYYTAAAAAAINARQAVRERTVAEDKVALSVVEKYGALLNDLEGKDYAGKFLQNAQLQLRNSKISFAQGLISASQLRMAEAGCKAAKSNWERTGLQLQESYRAFNSLIGYAPDSRPVLTEKLVYEALDASRPPEAEVSRILDECPTVWSVEQMAKLANLQLSLYNPAASPDPYEAKVIDVKKAELAAGDVREQMRGLIRLLYNAVQQSEEGYAALNEQAEIAREQLRVKQVMFDNGMATKYDVQKAELELAKVQKDLNSTVNKHEYLKKAFEKPWAYI